MWNCLQREMKILFYRRRMVFIVLIAAASAYALLIGTLYQNQTVQQIPVMVCDLNQSAGGPRRPQCRRGPGWRCGR